MKRPLAGHLVSLVLLAASWSPIGSAAAQAPTGRDRLLATARTIATTARYAAFITVGADGAAQARTVDPLLADTGFVVWVATNPRTRKVAELRRDPRVTLHWFDPAAAGYVTLKGVGRTVTDPKEVARRWKAEWAPFYPNRARDLLLIEIRPKSLEVVSPGHGVLGDSLTWRPPVVSFP